MKDFQLQSGELPFYHCNAMFNRVPQHPKQRGGGAQKFEGPHVCKWIWQVMATRKILRVGCKGLKHGTAFHRAMLSLRIACHKLCFSVFVRSSRPGVVSKRLKVSKILTSSGSQLIIRSVVYSQLNRFSKFSLGVDER